MERKNHLQDHGLINQTILCTLQMVDGCQLFMKLQHISDRQCIVAPWPLSVIVGAAVASGRVFPAGRQAALARKAQPRLEGGLPSGRRAGGRAAKQAQHQEAPATRRSSPPRSPPFRVRKLISELRAARAPRHRIISQVRKWRGRFAGGARAACGRATIGGRWWENYITPLLAFCQTT